MNEKIKEKHGPCTDKNCSECCNPVKTKRFMPPELIPKDKDGNDLWKKRRELLVPVDNPEEKLETYDCKNFDRKTGKCLDYENRPNICRGSGCIDPDSSESKENQFKKLSEKKFFKIK